MHHSSKHNFPGCQTEPDCGAGRTLCVKPRSVAEGDKGWGVVSHACLPQVAFYHSDACEGTVLTPHDYITNAQRGSGNRSNAGSSECRLCGSFLGAQLGHGETCSTAEATRGHCACVHAVLGGLRHPRNPEDSQKHNLDRLIFEAPLLSQDTARLWTCAWHPPKLQQPERDAAQAAYDRKNLSHERREIPRPTGSRHRVSSPGPDSTWSATPSSHPNPTTRSGHRILPQRATNVSESPSTQMDT